MFPKSIFKNPGKRDILAGLSKTSAYNAYKRGLQLILESEPLENISIAIMKQLTQKIQESDEVNIYRKEIYTSGK
ncbi:8866_t:CDS:2 [Entrophospora sp. SA101]|nr:8866_t:CDS:2 [Entrophospora sp. SA101]